jgi:toxin FitB
MRVTARYRATSDDELFLGVLVIGEIRQGIERLRPRNARQATALEKWLDELLASFGDRVLALNERIAQIWGGLNSREVLPVVESLLSASQRSSKYSNVAPGAAGRRL